MYSILACMPFVKNKKGGWVIHGEYTHTELVHLIQF